MPMLLDHYLDVGADETVRACLSFEKPYVGTVPHSVIMIRFLTVVSADNSSKI